MPSLAIIDQANMLLSDFAINRGTPFIRLNPQGFCSARCEAGFDVRIEVSEDGRMLYFVAALFDLPEAPAAQQAFYRYALHQNLIDPSLEGAVYAISPMLNAALLMRRAEIDHLDSMSTETLLTNFLGVSAHAEKRASEFLRDHVLATSIDRESPSSFSADAVQHFLARV